MDLGKGKDYLVVLLFLDWWARRELDD